MITLGLDSSTQSLKAVLIDTVQGSVLAECGVNFGQDLPEFDSPNGFIPNADPLIRRSNPLMWVKALDMLLSQMQSKGIPLQKVEAISGSGQQHGSVYLTKEASAALNTLDASRTLAEQIAPVLSRPLSPIWMDRSTASECAELTARFGTDMQKRTGSPATERFTGPQIRHFWHESPEQYENTAHIQLVSSFMCSILAGKIAPIDFGDGAGMNLLNLDTLAWDEEITDFTAPGLMSKLPPCVKGGTIVGTISPYFAKYGFRSDVKIVVWSGDNPCSLIGTGTAAPGTAGISLGTSDTFFANMDHFLTDPEGCGHVMGNPAGGFMSLICFTNGSLARENVRNTTGVDWDFFDHTVCELTPAGNDGKLMLPYFEAESTPLRLQPSVQYNFDVATATAAQRVRAILESQALTMRLHSLWTGTDIKHLKVTGGASKCKALLQIIADVFQARVETISVSDSAGMGAAMMAANGAGVLPLQPLYDVFCAPTAVY